MNKTQPSHSIVDRPCIASGAYDYSPSPQSRSQGCFLGLAVGDALGTTLCLFDRDKHPTIRDMSGVGPFNLPAGAWTDDTAMALALADSLIRKQGFDAADIMDSWCRWLEYGEYSATGVAVDIGKTIFRSLMHYKRTQEPYGFVDKRAAGNGAIMRLAPVVIAFQNKDALWRVVDDQTRLTHPSDEARDASYLFASILKAALNGTNKADLLVHQHDIATPSIQSIARGDFLQKDRAEIRSGGYVVETLEASLWSFYTTETFEDALLKAIYLCGDSDTVGAVTAQIAGAFYGVDAIPERWLAALFQAEKIRTITHKLMNCAADL